ncbi:MAG: ATP-binding cassette domain-containing protein [Candidatus Aenigmatarchaeota archaeon]|nr:ATP-binding cassette domain-containing protein [Candidatus Aenigmarchaeota archaeon]
MIIETYDLTRKYGKLVAVNKVNLTIEDGEVFGLLGPNGAGKTTLISMLCTILKPTSGTAKVNGYDIVKQQPQVRKSIGIVFQDPSLDDRLTGRENLEMHSALYGVPKNERKKRIDSVLELVGLTDKQDIIVRNYSGGMKRRLEIARGLIHYPKVLFLDEPTLGLDPQTREHIWAYIKNLSEKENITIVLTTHYMDEADILCDRVAIIDYGEIKVLGTPEALKGKLEGEVLILDTNDGEKLKKKIETLSFIKKIDVRGNELRVAVKGSEKYLPKIIDVAKQCNVSIESISIRKPTLSDVFLHYTGREIREEMGNVKEIMKAHARRWVR